MLLLLIIAPVLGALLVPWLARKSGRALGLICAAIPALIFAYLLYLLVQLDDSSAAVLDSVAWASTLGLDIDLRFDGLSIAFGLLISGIGALICLYANTYFHGKPQRSRFLCYLLLFMSAMLGVVFADNIIVLFVFWELTSIASYLLISFDQHKQQARDAALQALLTTGAGALALLAGLILLGNAAGSYRISDIISTPGLTDHAHYTAIMILVLAGSATKSAQFPFHFWLPNAMAAPTPASAYLHSSTMVKAGIYLLARLNPALGGTDFWFYALVSFGGATMLVAGWLALRQTELKPILAYSTVLALGMLVLCLGVGTPLAIKAFKVFLFVHAFYKAALFMIAGNLIHETGITRFEELRGLRKIMPYTAAGALVAALSMAGLPPLLGFVGKESVYEALLYAPAGTTILVAVAVLANVVNVYVAVVVGILPFWRKNEAKALASHDTSMGMWIGPGVLGVFGLVSGLFPGLMGKVILAPGIGTVLGEDLDVKLKLWHGVNTAFLLSLATLFLGMVLIALRFPWRRFASLFNPLDKIGPQSGYQGVLNSMLSIADYQTRFLQHGYLRYYLLVVVVCLICAVAGALQFPMTYGDFEHMDLSAHELITVILIALAAFAMTRVKSRFAALACLGVVGYGIALLYVYYGAPDLAKTQIVVESLTVVFFALLAAKMPDYRAFTSVAVRRRDAVIAALAGTLMGILVYTTLASNQTQPIANYYRENSLPLAHGKNVVNVILVDFRALDTLAEITVLAVAAFGAAALLRIRKGRKATS